MSTSPTFITGANAKIRLNGKTIAFCQDFHCSIEIYTKTPKVLGKYEGDSVEPLGYLVTGGFTLIRYAKGVKSAIGGTPKGLADNDAGNGVGNWGTVWDSGVGSILSRNGIGNDGRAHEALDPSKFATGTTFDIQFYQKVPNAPKPTTGEKISSTVREITDFLSGGNFDGPGDGNYLGVLNIRNARITRADFSVQKRSLASERFKFTALYVDGDGFVANASGMA